MGTLLLIDGNCLAARASFALPETIIGSNGQPVNAILGFTSTLLRLLSNHLPQMAAVAFDTNVPSFRHQLLSTYKAGRVPLPESFPRQLESIKLILDALSIKHYEVPSFEADDILATLASIAHRRGDNALIVSTDRDLIQLVRDPWVKLVLPRKGLGVYDIYDEAAVISRIGVAPSQYVDLSALRGDPSDNILGIRGVGTKTAAKLLAKFGSLEHLLEHLDALPVSLGEKLREEAERLRSNIKLMTLLRDVPVSDAPPYFDARLLPQDRLLEIFSRFSIEKLAKRVTELCESYSLHAAAATQAVIRRMPQDRCEQAIRPSACFQRICLVACSAEKEKVPLSAKDLYASVRFRKARLYAEQNYDAWFILSAKHGLVSPETVIEPYDFSLSALSDPGRQQWTDAVIGSLRQVSKPGDAITVLAEDDYAKPLVGLLREGGNRVHSPFEEMSRSECLRWLGAELSAFNMREDLETFYSLLGAVREGIRGPRWLRQCNGRMPWPEKGVYFFLEPREIRFNKDCIRITRVGTHAVSRGATSTLWGRLRTHRGIGSRGGAHRSSVFRLHVGSAILSKAGRQDQFAHWGRGVRADKEILTHEALLESEVSAYIGDMEVLYLNINDAPSSVSDRAYIEKNAIALLSRAGSAVDPPSESWLGLFSPSLAIRRSGLWNLNYVNGPYDRNFLEVLRYYVDVTLGHIEHDGASVAPSRWRGEDSRLEQLKLFSTKDDNHE